MKGYSAQNVDEERCARALLRSSQISFKHAVEICRYLKHRKLGDAMDTLDRVIEKKEPVPFRRFYHGTPHRPKIGAGRYPMKASAEIIHLLKSVSANAQFKGLNTGELVITHMAAHLGSRPWHTGRRRRRKIKRTHVEVVVEEKKARVKEKGAKVTSEKDIKKQEIKARVSKKTKKQKEEPVRSGQ